MSGNKISWTWRHAIGKSGLPFTTKGVLWAISHFMNEAGQGAYPTTKHLAEYCSLSERAVCTHIQNACDAGWLVKKEHGFKGQKWKNHEYEAQWPDEDGMSQGTELGSVAWSEGTERHAKGTEPNDKKALNEVQSIVPVNIPSKVSPLSPPKGKGSRLPEKWYPSDEGCQLATSLGVNPDTEIEVFRDYWIAVSGSKGVKLDWDATWRNWVRRAKPSTQNKKSQSEIMIEAFARA